MKSVQAGKARFLCSSPKLISQLTGAPSCDNVSSRGLHNPKSSKVSGDTISEQDICIPAIHVKVMTLDLNLSIQTNKQDFHLWEGYMCVANLIFFEVERQQEWGGSIGGIKVMGGFVVTLILSGGPNRARAPLSETGT